MPDQQNASDGLVSEIPLPVRILVIAGSGRPDSQSTRVATAICEVLREAGITATLLDLQVLNLPFWDEATTLDPTWRETHWNPTSRDLIDADGFVVVTPEWDGMVPPQLKNFFVFCDHCELAHKPGLIVSIADGLSGSYPVSELRMSSYKNTFIVWLPVHIIIRNVTRITFERNISGNDDSTRIVQRLANGLEILVEYASALRAVRHSCADALAAHEFGM